MTRNYDYRTPRDRLDPSFRMMLDDEKAPTVFAFRTDESSDDCGGDGALFLGNSSLPLAMIYSPYQRFENLYDTDDALCRGTLFKDLDFPFEAYCCGRKETKR